MPKSPEAQSIEDRIAKAKAKIHNPISAIRAKCIDCVGANLADIRNCEIANCALYPYRLGTDPFRGKPKPANYLPVMKAIRAECLDCNKIPSEVKKCPATGCALYALRMGKNPFREKKPAERPIFSGELGKAMATEGVDIQAKKSPVSA